MNLDKIIDAKSIQLIKFFDIEDKKIYIPIFQRNYDWTVEECERLFKDFQTLFNNINYKHFIGSIFYSIDEDSGDCLLIDGQQRLTSFTILMIAFWKILSDKKDNTEDFILTKNEIRKIIFKEDSKELKLKLKFSSEYQDTLLNDLINYPNEYLENKKKMKKILN